MIYKGNLKVLLTYYDAIWWMLATALKCDYLLGLRYDARQNVTSIANGDWRESSRVSG